MIISALVNLIYGLLSLLLVFNLPQLPATFTTLLDQISGYLVGGVGLLRSMVGDTCMGVISVCLQLVIFCNAAYFLYSFVFWVIKKIPMLNIRE
jgi:hypothetical protein